MKNPEPLNLSLVSCTEIFNLTPLPMWIYDEESLKVLRVNDAAIAHYGYSREEFCSLDVTQLQPAEDNEVVKQESSYAPAKDLCRDGRNTRHQKKCGSWIDVKLKSSRIRLGTKKGVLVLACDITDELQSRQAMERNQLFLKALSEVNSALQTSSNWADAIDKAFEVVGHALNVDRVYYFENQQDHATGELFSSQKVEWCREEVEPQISNPELQEIPFAEVLESMAPLQQNQHFNAIVSRLTDSSTRKILQHQNIASLLVVPIFFNNTFKGFVGVDDCHNEREWQQDEVDFLDTLCGNMAGALQRREILNELEQRERKFSAMVQEGLDMIAIIDDMGNYQYVSPTASAVLGYPVEHYIGKNTFDFIHPEDIARILSFLKEAPTRQALTLPHYRFQDSDGNWCWLETTITNLLDDPAIRGVVCNTRDLSSEKKHEGNIRLSNERFKLAMKATNEMIWDWDIASDTVYRGSSYHTKFGYALTEKTHDANSWFSQINPEDRSTVWESLQEAIGDSKTKYWQAEYRLGNKQGGTFFIHDRCYIIRNEEGEIIRAVGAALDVTESRLQLQEIQRQNNALREIAWLQSHVVRAPLSRMMGLVELIRKHDTGGKPLNELLELIDVSACELDEVIRKIAHKTDLIDTKPIDETSHSPD